MHSHAYTRWYVWWELATGAKGKASSREYVSPPMMKA